MYCNKCHRQSPDNFTYCPYCSAELENGKKKKPEMFIDKKKFNINIPLKNTVIGIIVVAFILVIAALITASVTGSKPDKVVADLVEAVNHNNESAYYALFDNSLKEYKKNNRYFDEEETISAMTQPLRDSREFYAEKCGDDFKLSYEINHVTYYNDEEIEAFNKQLSDTYGYIKLPDKVAKLKIEITATGEKGAYKSVYTDFLCIKIGGKWFMFIP